MLQLVAPQMLVLPDQMNDAVCVSSAVAVAYVQRRIFWSC